MERTGSLRHSLIEADDSVLIVIDVQDRFLDKLPAPERDHLVNRIGWLVDAARQLGIPIIVTAENVSELGGVVPSIAQRLPAEASVFNKMVFSLAEEREILGAIVETGRSTAILVGLETDVCVAHSALGLIDQGFEVVVVADGTGSPGLGQEIGLERVRRAGSLISSVKAVYYEWVRTVGGDERFFDQARTAHLPEGVSL